MFTGKYETTHVWQLTIDNFFGGDSGMSVHRHYVHGRWSSHVDQTDINMVWLSNMSNMYN